MSITVKNVSKRFDSFAALTEVSLDVADGTLVALLGPSGSGKTTLLRVIAGLEVPDSGSVLVEGEDVTRASPQARNIGFVFQHYALFKHMTVFENVAFALRVRRRPDAEVRDRVGELLRLIRLEGLGSRYPGQLSGGQRQRVALARALAARPRLLLLDEPFGALDAKVRQELRDWLRRLHHEIRVTSLFVTHDQEEAFSVADRVVVMRGGRIEQTGTPAAVFERPANAFVMDFLGQVNVFPGRVRNGRALLGDLELAPAAYLQDAARPATLYVRPHELELVAVPNGKPSFPAEVLHLNPAGPVMRVALRAAEIAQTIQVDVSHDRLCELGLKAGDRIHVAPRQVRVFSPEGDADYSI